MSHHSSTAALLCMTLMFAAMPLAAGAAETRVGVQAGDLNLATDAGRAVLRQRISRAVDTVCGSAHGRTTSDVQAYATCSQSARASAGSQFDSMVAAALSGRKVAADRGAAPSLQ